MHNTANMLIPITLSTWILLNKNHLHLLYLKIKPIFRQAVTDF